MLGSHLGERDSCRKDEMREVGVGGRGEVGLGGMTDCRWVMEG